MAEKPEKAEGTLIFKLASRPMAALKKAIRTKKAIRPFSGPKRKIKGIKNVGAIRLMIRNAPAREKNPLREKVFVMSMRMDWKAREITKVKLSKIRPIRYFAVTSEALLYGSAAL